MSDRDPNVVVIGGGTGLSSLVKGLKRYPVHLTAIITVSDDGGSSGELRKDSNMVPPGDIRKVLVAMAEVDDLMEQLFQYRFDETHEGLSGHPTGNLLLVALANITGDFVKGIQQFSKVLNVKGDVLPVSTKQLVLSALMEDGTVVTGESSITGAGNKIKEVYFEDEDIPATKEAVEAIEKADLIVFGPGSLYTSIIPNILVPEIKEAVKQSKAKKLFISNVMTEVGESIGFTVGDHIKAFEDHFGEEIIDIIIANDHIEVDDEEMKNYHLEGAECVQLDYDYITKTDKILYTSNLFSVNENGHIRHNSRKLAAEIFFLLINGDED